ncbi:MAG: peptidoglycan DD-metalloendopeptidase family protein [Myxococcota bacterium]|nr:peptidoglycan DD-metalloendopeptidase family protein [Myxococcota bacterium]
MRRVAFATAFVLFGLFAACSSENPSGEDAEGTAGSAGATGGTNAGEEKGTGGAFPNTGGTITDTGEASTDIGGAGTSTGGASTDTGGANTGGANTGGANTGGANTGGANTGGANTGGEDGSSSPGEGASAGAFPEAEGLSWPIDCVPGDTCVGLGYPDTDKDGVAHDCSDPGYAGHEGTDIAIPLQAQLDGTAVRAAADGEVLFAFDGKFDQCPDDDEPDCQAPASFEPGARIGTTVCTPVGNYCGTGEPGCFWCFAGGNVIVIRHDGVPGVFATRYDHLKKDSVLVEPGEVVTRGQKIAEAGSAGNSTGSHLHFEVWGTGFYELADPWAGDCGPNPGPSLWAYDPPWSG